MTNNTNDVDTYIAQFNGETRQRLERLRALVRETAPDAEESFSYGLVGYKRNSKPLVYFGGFEHHVGFYATPNGHEAFKEEFANYKQGKGSVQLPPGPATTRGAHTTRYRVPDFANREIGRKPTKPPTSRCHASTSRK